MSRSYAAALIGALALAVTSVAAEPAQALPTPAPLAETGGDAALVQHVRLVRHGRHFRRHAHRRAFRVHRRFHRVHLIRRRLRRL